MNIILDECKWAEKAIEEMTLGKKPFDTLSRIAKYYMHSGKSASDTRELIEQFIKSCDASASMLKWSDRIDNVMKYADRNPIITIGCIDITEDEIEKIKKIDSSQIQRLAFTLLCIAKYGDAINPLKDHWVNVPDNEIMRMANINTSISRQCMMMAKLRDLGMIRMSKRVDNLSVQVLFVGGEKSALKIYDFRNIGYQYQKYCGGNFFVCSNCGITVKSNGNIGRPQKYCPTCANKIQLKQKVEYVSRHRLGSKYAIVEKN